jgi:hypothetical protein
VVVLVGETTKLPLTACVPVQPPLAVHEAAFTVDQLSVVLPPLAIDRAAAVNVTVGAGVTMIVAVACVEPPAPLQVSM